MTSYAVYLAPAVSLPVLVLLGWLFYKAIHVIARFGWQMNFSRIHWDMFGTCLISLGVLLLGYFAGGWAGVRVALAIVLILLGMIAWIYDR